MNMFKLLETILILYKYYTTSIYTAAPQVQVSPALSVVNQSSSVVLTCVAAGIPIPAITWTKESNTDVALTNISTIQSISTTSQGNTSTSVLVINRAIRTDMDTYTCTGENSLAVQAASTEVFVQGKLSLMACTVMTVLYIYVNKLPPTHDLQFQLTYMMVHC